MVALLAGAENRSQLLAAAEPIAQELHADHVQFVEAAAEASRQVTQVLIDDSAADPAELEQLMSTGHRSLLRVPMTSGNSGVSEIEIYRRHHRPWSRHEIGRAHMIAYQLEAAFARLAPAAPAQHPISDAASVQASASALR